MKLRELTRDDQELYVNFVNKWLITGEKKITPFSANLNGLTFQQWLIKLEKDKLGNGFVPAKTLFLEVGNQLVGAVQLRFELTEDLLKIGGNIGYGVVPSERGKGYADIMLRQGLAIFKKRMIPKVLLTCDQSNGASQTTIKKNGGKFEAEEWISGRKVQRFWIDLTN